MKKLFSIILTIAIIICTLPMSALTASAANAENGSCGDNLTWSLDADSGVLTISGSGAMTNYTNSSDVPWYSYRSLIKEVVISDSVTSIGDLAFCGCKSLTKITIPDSVTSIGWSAFSGCTSLAEITIPDSVTSIGSSAFEGCTSLGKVNITDIVAWCNIDFDYYASTPMYFAENIYLNGQPITEVNIPEGFTKINDDTFYGFKDLVKVTIPDSVTSIGDSAFAGCINLTEIAIPDSITSIYDCAFASCTSLDEITIHDSVTRIGYNAFYNCTSLETVNITDIVAWCKIEFDNYASNPMYYAENIYLNGQLITEITIPDSVTSIDDYAFYGCTSLKTVNNYSGLPIVKGSSTYGYVGYYADTVNWYHTDTGNCGENLTYTFDATIGVLTISGSGDMTNYSSSNAPWYLYRSLIKEIILSDDITRIGDSVFFGCTSLTEITIPDSVTSIGRSAFCDCTGLTEIAIPDGVTIINAYTFYNCTDLTSVTIGNSVKNIGDYAFEGCTNLKTVNNYSGIPIVKNSSDYGYVGYYADTINWYGTAIGNFDKLTYKFDANTGVLTIAGNGYMVNYYNVTNSPWFSYNSLIKKIVISEGVTSIGGRAFYGCKNLTEITISDSVTSIGGGAFSGCTSLAEITIPDGVTSIGSYAFSGCTSLTEITIPDSVTSIGDYAFSGCTSLAEITIPDSVTSIGSYAFLGCTSLKTVNITDIVAWCNIDFDNYASTPMYYAKNIYLNGQPIIEVNITDGFTKINDYTFYGFKDLVKITIPNSVTSIGASAFDGTAYYNNSDNWVNNVLNINNHLIKGKETISGKYVIKDGIKTIADSAFENCTSLTEITIPDSVTSIDYSAFNGCTNLVVNCSAGTYAAQYCEEHNIAIKYTGGSENVEGFWSFDFDTGNLIIENMTADYTTSNTAPWYKYKDHIKNVQILDDVTKISDYAFYGCNGLQSVVITDSVTSIGENTFSGCTDFVVSCNAGTYTAQYCEEHNIAIKYTGGSENAEGFWYFDFDTGNLIIENMTADYTASNTAPWYKYKDYIKTVQILDGVTKITNYDFYGCNKIANITIPNSVTSIGASAFSGCNNVQIICNADSYAANYCKQNGISAEYTGGILRENGYWSLDFETGAFTLESMSDNYGSAQEVPWHKYRDKIKTVNILNGVNGIAGYAFYGCSNLKQIKLPSSVTSIDISAFENSGLESVVISATMQRLNEKAFYNCDNLKSVIFDGEDLSIGHSAFANCTSLEEVVLPYGLRDLFAGGIFENCTSLQNLFMPQSLTQINSKTFDGCTNLKLTLYYGTTAHSFAVENNILFDFYIGDGLSYSYDTLTQTLTISGNGVMIDGMLPWSEYSADIKTVIINNGVINIGSGAFSGCTALSEIIIPDSVEVIGGFAFSGCSKLRKITMGKNIKYIGTNAFTDANVESVYINDLANWCNIDFADADANPFVHKALLYYNNKLVKDLVIPEGVTKIKDYAFYNCPNIISIAFPKSLVEIGENAFRNNNALKSVKIESGLKKIGTNAFSKEKAVETVYITDVEAWLNIDFANYAANPLCEAKELYLNNQRLKTLIIPNTVTEIKPYAFYNFSGIDTLVFSNNPDLTIGEEAFLFTNFKTVIYPDGVEVVRQGINVASNAHIVISDTVGFIYDYAANGDAIFGKVGSVAESYAVDNDIQFYKMPQSVSINSLPQKTVYYLDRDSQYTVTTGLSINVLNYDGTTSVINKDLIVDSIDFLKEGKQSITVSFGGKTTSFDVYVYDSKLSNISISKLPTKTEYNLGEEFSPQGIIITANYENNTNKQISESEVEFIGFDSKKIGKQTITVKFNGKTAKFDITVLKGEVDRIEIINLPTKTKYALGEELSLQGMAVMAYYAYDNSEQIDLNNLQISGFDNSKLGKQTLTVTYNGKTATFDINVVLGTPKRIEITALPTKTEYVLGEELSLQGMAVMAYYAYDNSEQIDINDLQISGFNSQNAGEQIITVLYNGKTASFKINVKAKEYFATWRQSGSRWWYDYGDGTYAKGWSEIDGYWYYFDAEGWMQTGWLKLRNTWYYLKSSGAMVTDWQKIGGVWYYFNTDGAMQTGWQEIDGTWYYLKSSGAMSTGWLKQGNTWYYLNSSGAMQTGWEKVGNTWYYFNASGAMKTGWLKLGGTWYYFTSGGAMLANTSRAIGGKVYRFNASGACLNP